MSSSVHKYIIVYDGNDGFTYTENIYCKFEHVDDSQKWCTESGESLNFDCLTDSHAMVRAACIAGVETNDKYFYWKEIKDFEMPNSVAIRFNYAIDNSKIKLEESQCKEK